MWGLGKFWTVSGNLKRLLSMYAPTSGEPLVIFLGTEGSRLSTAPQKEPQAIHAWGAGRCLSVQAVEAE
jgi:hypothetical protein